MVHPITSRVLEAILFSFYWRVRVDYVSWRFFFLSPACALFFGIFLPSLSMSIVSYRSDRYNGSKNPPFGCFPSKAHPRLLYDHQRFLLQPFFLTINFKSEPFIWRFKLDAFFWACFLVRKRRLVTVIGIFPFLLAINHFFWSLTCE